MPSVGNPQDLSRYSLHCQQPCPISGITGHSYCVDVDCEILQPASGGPLQARNGLMAAAYSALRELGGINDLEAMAQIADVGASAFRTWERILPALGQVFTGPGAYGPAALFRALAANVATGGCGGLGRETLDCSGNATSFADRGFHPDFQDRHNQPYHAWGGTSRRPPQPAMAVSFSRPSGSPLGHAANIGHEIIQSAFPTGDGWGTSWEDFTLSWAAMNIGTRISTGAIQPAQLAAALRKDLGPIGNGSSGIASVLNSIRPLRGSPPGGR